MASIYRRKYRDRNGKLRETSKWYVEFGDHHGQFPRLPAFVDKRASEELGHKLERLAGLRAAGEQPAPALTRWLSELPATIRGKLANIGLLDSASIASSKPLRDHLDGYTQALRDGAASPRQKGPATPEHVTLTANRIRLVVDGIRARTLSDVTAAKVARYLAERRDNGLSAKSSNHYLMAFKAFLNWMVRERLTTENQLAHVSKMQVRDRARRHVRRSLELDEMRRLLSSTSAAPTRYGMTGPARALL